MGKLLLRTPAHDPFATVAALFATGDVRFVNHRDYPATAYGYLARLTLSRGAPPRLAACPYRIVGLVRCLSWATRAAASTKRPSSADSDA